MQNILWKNCLKVTVYAKWLPESSSSQRRGNNSWPTSAQVKAIWASELSLANHISVLIKPYEIPIPYKLQFNYPVISPETGFYPTTTQITNMWKNTIKKVPTLASNWLKHAKILEFIVTLQQYLLSSILHLSDWVGLETNTVTYIIEEVAHHLTFIIVIKTSFKHHLMAFNKHSLTLQDNY